MPAHQLPKLLGVLRMYQVAQLMDHHIVIDGMGCLDDVPVEDHQTLLVAGPTSVFSLWRVATVPISPFEV